MAPSHYEPVVAPSGNPGEQNLKEQDSSRQDPSKRYQSKPESSKQDPSKREQSEPDPAGSRERGDPATQGAGTEVHEAVRS